MLISLLVPLLESFEFSGNVIEFGDYTSHLYINRESSDYFILLDKTDIDLADLEQLYIQDLNRLDEIIKQSDFINEAYEKNTTLILCIRNNTDLQDTSIVSNIEEDKYLFKKNILFYSSSEIDELNTLFDGEYTQDKANAIMRSEDCFDTIKNNRPGGYTLLARLFIKLPFLSLQSHQVDLENLSLIIHNEAINQNIVELYNTISNTDIDLSQISSFNDLKSLGLIEEAADE
jgi:hypothetical protein